MKRSSWKGGYKNERRVEMEVTSDERASVFFGRKVKMQVGGCVALGQYSRGPQLLRWDMQLEKD